MDNTQGRGVPALARLVIPAALVGAMSALTPIALSVTGEHLEDFVIIVVKLAALLAAASCGFRGGRIFPAVFVAVAPGQLAHRLVDRVPLPLAEPAAPPAASG